MNAVQEYVDCLEKLVETQRAELEQYRKINESQRAEIELGDTVIAACKELICQLIEGRVSEETKSKMLSKFRG